MRLIALTLALLLLLLAACGPSNSGAPTDGESIKAVNDTAPAMVQRVQAAQDAFRLASGRYAADLAELYNNGADPSYIDADLADGVTGSLAVRLLTAGPDAYVVTVVAGRSAVPVPDAEHAPDTDFAATAPYKYFLGNESHLLTGARPEIAAQTARVINLQAQLLLGQLQTAQSAYFAANGAYAHSLAELYNSGSDPSYIDSQMASGQVGYVGLALWSDAQTQYEAEVSAATANGLYRLYQGSEGSDVNTTTVDDKAKDLARMIVQAQHDYQAKHGHYGRELYDLDNPELTQFIYQRQNFNNIWVTLIYIDGARFDLITGGGARSPDRSDFSSKEPYHVYWTDQDGGLSEDPAEINKLAINAINLQARSAVEQIVAAEKAYSEANHGRFASTYELYNSGVDPSYIDDTMGTTGALGNWVMLDLDADMDKFTAQCSVGIAPFNVYVADQTGQVSQTTVENLARQNITGRVQAQEQFRSRVGRYAYSRVELSEAVPAGSRQTGFATAEFLGIDDNHYLVLAGENLDVSPDHYRAPGPYVTYFSKEDGNIAEAPANLDQLADAATKQLSKTFLAKVLAAQVAFHAANGTYAFTLGDLEKAPDHRHYLDEVIAFNRARFVNLTMASTGGMFTVTATASLSGGNKAVYTGDETGAIVE